MPSPRQILSIAATLALLLLADPQPVTYVVGCCLAAMGLAVRIWGCGHLRKNKEVVTSGPYRYVKNPLYVGTCLISVGGIVAAGAPTMPALLVWAVLGPAFLIVFFGFYMPRKKRIESARLTKFFGEAYAVYDRAVPAFVPSLRPYPAAAIRPWRLAVFLDNHELGLDLLLIAAFAVMPFVRDWVFGA
ncbi:MAG TPA: methyltransferase [Planctomycetota bacterium]|nr:methyltransferase [Planctomycetota bacterium]